GPRRVRRLHLQHDPLRPGAHAALWRQGVPARGSLGHRELRPLAPGWRGGGPMTGQHVHDRLVARSVSGRYTAFLGIGGGLTVLGLILLLRAFSGDGAVRAWQLFHVNWLYFTGLMFGGV